MKLGIFHCLRLVLYGRRYRGWPYACPQVTGSHYTYRSVIASVQNIAQTDSNFNYTDRDGVISHVGFLLRNLDLNPRLALTERVICAGAGYSPSVFEFSQLIIIPPLLHFHL
jgi:hypothetical protein